MSDFASAAMMRVLAQGLRESGLDPGPWAKGPAEARVSLLDKQTLVRSAVRQGGLACLPLLGRGLHRLAGEPTHQALASARGARDLLERWQRLERYIHSRHRCRIESCDAAQAQVRHLARGQGPSPSAAEDLVVAGVLAALLEAIGLQDVRAWAGAAPAYPEPDASALEQAAGRGETSAWRFAWRPAASRPPGRNLGDGQPTLAADPVWPPPARSVYARLVADLTRPLPLPELAADLGVPGRTLQRQLAASGLSYSHLLAEARCRAGAWRLLNTADPIAEVGFLSGFADQSHFTREMQRRVGLAPAAYRQAFGAVRPLAAEEGAC